MTPQTPLHWIQNLTQPGRFAGPKWSRIAGPKWDRIAVPLLFSLPNGGGEEPGLDRIAGPKWERFSSSFSFIWGLYFAPFFVLIFFLFGCPFWLRFSSSASSFWVSILVLCFVFIDFEGPTLLLVSTTGSSSRSRMAACFAPQRAAAGCCYRAALQHSCCGSV